MDHRQRFTNSKNDNDLTQEQITKICKVSDTTNISKYGCILIKLNDLVKKEGISKNKLCHRAEIQRTQLNRYCNNDIARLDINVLARLCTVLHCEISDLLEFVPDSEDTRMF